MRVEPFTDIVDEKFSNTEAVDSLIKKSKMQRKAPESAQHETSRNMALDRFRQPSMSTVLKAAGKREASSTSKERPIMMLSNF